MYRPFNINDNMNKEETRKFLDRIAEAHDKEVAEANAVAEEERLAREKARAEGRGAPALESKTSIASLTNGKIVYTDGTEEILRYTDGIKEITERQFGTNIAEVVLPASVKTIGFSAFDSCESLARLEIPESVMRIEGFAFSGCNSLTHVTVPASVTEIRNNAFSTCEKLETVDILGDTKICKDAFSYLVNLKNIHMPNVTKLGIASFHNCLNLESLVLPEKLRVLEYSNFYQCPRLKSVTIPAAIEEINDDCFGRCEEFKEVNISIAEGVTSISKEDFCWCPAMAWKPPVPGRTKMGKRCFPKIETVGVMIPASVTEIGDGAFEYVYNLKNIYYAGSKADFEKIRIGKNNPKINGLFGRAKIYYDYK